MTKLSMSEKTEIEEIKSKVAKNPSLSEEIMNQIWKYADQQELNPNHPNICKICGQHGQSDIHAICRRNRVEEIVGKCSCGGYETVKEGFEDCGVEFFVNCGSCGRFLESNYNPDPDEIQAIMRSRSE